MKNIIFVIAAFMLLVPAAFGQNSTADWPTAKFRFEVEYTFNGKTSTSEVQEVTGLDSETDVIEYRKGDLKTTELKMPGIKKFSDVTLKKGMFADDGKTLYEWYRSIRADANPTRGTIIIRLLDEGGNPTMIWTLKNAFPKKVIGIDENKGTFETIVLTHEGVTIAKTDK